MPHAPPFLELLNPRLLRGGFRAVLFDFDGTLSFLREGWPQIMSAMMVNILRQTPQAEEEAALALVVEDFITRLNGKSTIHQMTQLAEEVRQRGGVPLEASEYKRTYVTELMALVGRRRTVVSSGQESPQRWTVPGSFDLLAHLQARGLSLTLASGTDRVHVVREAELLGVAPYFGERIFAPVHEQDGFSKHRVIEDLLAESGLPGAALLSFGDGMVETAAVKEAGGVAIGVASDLEQPGQVNAWKRRQLIAAGADVVVADYARAEELVTWLCHCTREMRSTSSGL